MVRDWHHAVVNRLAPGSLKPIPNGDATFDYLPVLQIFGIQGVALGLERRCSNQTVEDAVAVLRGDAPAGVMNVDRQWKRRGTKYSDRGKSFDLFP